MVGSPKINFQIQGCQIYPKDRSRGRDSFELQRTGHAYQGGEVINCFVLVYKENDNDNDKSDKVLAVVCVLITKWHNYACSSAR